MSYLSDKLGELIFSPNPVRALATKVCRKFKLGSYERRLKLGAVENRGMDIWFIMRLVWPKNFSTSASAFWNSA